MTSLPRSPPPGTVLLGKYRVEGVIGEGGMGVVVRAQHLDLDEPVAIKILLPDLLHRADIVQRFLREARAAVKLKGPHVARVLDVGRFESNLPYIVMEFLQGTDLNTVVRSMGAQPAPLVVDLMLQACDAIAEAHSIGIIHRDIKASNFFVLTGEPPVLKVLDFGIATAPEGASDLTSTLAVMGTPSYMAPEQMRSTRSADARSDIWSIGVVLYELLEGERPFRAEGFAELCLMVALDPPVPMMRPVPPGLHAIVQRCLAKPIDERFQTVAELAMALAPFAGDPLRARTIVDRCHQFATRRAVSLAIPPARASLADLAPDSVTPPSATPVPQVVPLTPLPQAATIAADVPMVLGRPTPPQMPAVRTPTSLHASAGELTGSQAALMQPARRGRTAVIASALVAMLALAGVGIYAAQRGGDRETPASQPIAAPPATVQAPAEPSAMRTPPPPVPPAALPLPVPATAEPVVPPATAEPAVPPAADPPQPPRAAPVGTRAGGKKPVPKATERKPPRLPRPDAKPPQRRDMFDRR